MGKAWDAWVPGPEVWREVYRVLKPGGTLLCFAGTRSLDLMGIALRLAGFDLWDTIATFGAAPEQPSLLEWVHGQGFPKASDLGKLFDKREGAEREVVGHGEPSGMGRYNDGNAAHGYRPGSYSENGPTVLTAPATDLARLWDGWKSHGLKPAHEPILCARKPNAGSYCDNAVAHGVAGLNIEGGRVALEEKPGGWWGCAQSTVPFSGGERHSDGRSYRTEMPSGRYPSNVILTCACEGDEHGPDCPVAVMDGQSGETAITGRRSLASRERDVPGTSFGTANHRSQEYANDHGGASRFFYCAKASRREREAGCEDLPERPSHPTVKPVALIEYLCRLTATPSGGTVLDPFLGSGTTAVACVNTGRRFIGIELSPDYCDIANARIAAARRALQPALALETEEAP